MGKAVAISNSAISGVRVAAYAGPFPRGTVITGVEVEISGIAFSSGMSASVASFSQPGPSTSPDSHFASGRPLYQRGNASIGSPVSAGLLFGDGAIHLPGYRVENDGWVGVMIPDWVSDWGVILTVNTAEQEGR